MQKRRQPYLIILVFLVLCSAMLIMKPKEASVQTAAKKTAQVSVELENQKSESEEPEGSDLQLFLDQMTLEEKVGQLFFSRVPATNQIEDLQTYHLGGYILFGRDIKDQSLESLTTTLATYQTYAKIPLLIGSDEEGGSVTRLSRLLSSPFRSPQALYQEGGLAAVLEDTHDKAQILNQLGVKAGLFPVADIAQDDKSFIYSRTLGTDLETTKTYIAEVVRALKEEQSGSTLKHFPGYGDNVDSHTAIVYDNRSLQDLQDFDFQVFKAGIDAGADSILVAHNIVPAIDEVPSSISPKINQILREDLGFDGVIMTDDMDMVGLADFISQEEAAYQVLLAGNDMIVSSQYAVQIPYLLEKLASGDLTEERLDQSVKRILQWKIDLGLLNLDKTTEED